MKGIVGLLPQLRGPKQPHKLTPEIMEYIENKISQDSTLRATTLKELIKKHFNISIHPRSIEKAIERKQKKIKKREKC